MRSTPIIGFLMMIFPVCSFAQESDSILACQFLDSAGFVWEDQRWKRTGFNLEKPFFLQVSQGRLVHNQSLRDLVLATELSCTFSDFAKRETCGDETTMLHIGHETLNGVLVHMYGASQSYSDTDKDTVAVTLFTCERMQ